jgi:glycosyltransferase involved in cell wall biosynthesis
MMTGGTDNPLNVIIIAQNEEPNIEEGLASVIGWAKQVFVVDGFSTDRTAELAGGCGAEVVQHEFVDWATQRNWALDNLPLRTEWIFFLDADERATDEFKQALEETLSSASDDLAGIYICKTLYFLSRPLPHAHEPPHLRIVRLGRACWIGEGAREYCRVEGRTITIKEPLVHWDRKGLHHWIEKQNRNATREALVILKGQQGREITGEQGALLERPLRTWIRTRLYARLPGWLRPFLHFAYRYFLRGGFLDGYAGFVYCFLHAFWLPLLINAKVYEAKHAKTP